ncbi:MAG: Na+/H+ antiporter NhaA [Crocinitomicaceae bacterium]|nr:Na+/H+ antiporter NhaA [Crocinitomicaceae bacterium]
MTKDKTPIEKVVAPLQKFIQQEKSGGLVLGISVIIALFLANSPWSNYYFELLEYKFGFYFNGTTYLEHDILHWINDGLMSIFFFVVGLELKREFVAGELANPRKALLPIIAAIGGMIVPAFIYFSLNPVGEVHSGWGIPMATDIAIALGVLYLLGDRIPLPLKVFLTALAIVDDLGAVLVIALFYTSDISIFNLSIGVIILLIMYLGKKTGVRSVWFYAILGICGVWTSFLLSGVHATISAVLAAFIIPSDVKLKEESYIEKLQEHLNSFKKIDPKDTIPTLTNEQLEVLDNLKKDTNKAIPPLQKLEHAMHPAITFLILPIFAIANAGVNILDINFDVLFNTNVMIGVAFGLLFGKVIGVFGFTWLSAKLKIAQFPTGMNLKNLFGLGLLASIGFTMSLFVTSLAFTHEEYVMQAKIGIFSASIIGGVLGYLVLKRVTKKT